jgi:hypothetical protein
MKVLLHTLTVIGMILASSMVVSAQSVPPTTAVRFVVSGGVSPVTNDLPIASIVCNQTAPAPTSGTVHNPTKVVYDDPAVSGKVCIYTDTGTGPLLSLPLGATVYTATAAFVNSVGAGPVSAVSNPFDHPGTAPTVAPTGLRVTP